MIHRMEYDASHGSLRSFLKDTRATKGVWSPGAWKRNRERLANQCACGVTTARFVCTMLQGTGRSRFTIEDVAECEACGRQRAMAILRARQEHVGIFPAVRQREQLHLKELEAA